MTKTTTKSAATKPATRKPVTKPATRKPVATKAADFAPVALAAKTYVRGMIEHEEANAITAEMMGEALSAIFPKREPRFGMRADGKSYRASNSNAPLAYVALWAAVYDGAAIRHPDGKIQWTDESQKGHRRNIWSAVLAFVRGEIETFSWNLSRQRTKEKDAAEGAEGAEGAESKVKETATESIMRRLKLIDGEIEKKVDSGPHAQNARALIRRAIEEIAKIQ